MNDIEDTIQQAVAACELEVYGIERSREGFIVYIENKDHNVSIKDCEMVMKQITYSTDTDDLHIEVSSKGLYPPLFTEAHYQASIGEWIKVRTHDKTFKGELKAIMDNHVQIEKGEHQFNVSLESIQSARLVPKPKGE